MSDALIKDVKADPRDILVAHKQSERIYWKMQNLLTLVNVMVNGSEYQKSELSDVARCYIEDIIDECKTHLKMCESIRFVAKHDEMKVIE